MLIQKIEDGKVLGNTTGATETATGVKTKSTMDETKEMFLQLLVAEMQYQDPLEPTDNSEYVKELATFTQVETLSAMQGNIEQMSANTMVGKYVSLTDPDTGKVVEGKVDYVTTDSGEQYVSVDGKLYKASTVTAIHDDSYYEAVAMADTFSSLVNQMPAVKELTAADEEKWGVLNSIYSDMSADQKKYLSDETMNAFAAINSRMSEIMAKEAQKNAKAAEEAEAAASTTANTAAAEANIPTAAETNQSGNTASDSTKSTDDTKTTDAKDTQSTDADGDAKSTGVSDDAAAVVATGSQTAAESAEDSSEETSEGEDEIKTTVV